MPVLDPDKVRFWMERRGLSRRQVCEQAVIADGTLRNLLRPQNVSELTHQTLARLLRVQPHELLKNHTLGEPPVRRRDISGVWVGEGVDVVVPGHFEYTMPPVPYTFEMTITQNGWEFTATGWLIGQEKVQQPFQADGRLTEDGNFVSLRWLNANPQVHDYGLALLEYTADGKRLAGYFLGRERNHGTPLVLGRIDARRRPPAAG